VRKRIGALRNKGDLWYDVKENTDEAKVISEMKNNVLNYILPYFNRIRTKELFIDFIDNENLILAPLGKLIVYGELNQYEKAKDEYRKILNGKSNPHFLETAKKYAQQYGIA
jgi:hypothetical protein